MKLETAKIILNECTREELRDHAFGDAEVMWFKDGIEIASGYCGTKAYVYLTPETSFYDDDARLLFGCGSEVKIHRNDETGPDDFVVGRVMPGLTKEGVLKELTDSCPHGFEGGGFDCPECANTQHVTVQLGR